MPSLNKEKVRIDSGIALLINAIINIILFCFVLFWKVTFYESFLSWIFYNLVLTKWSRVSHAELNLAVRRVESRACRLARYKALLR